MKTNKTTRKALAALVTALVSIGTAHGAAAAETTTTVTTTTTETAPVTRVTSTEWETTTTPVPATGTRVLNLDEIDINHDNLLTSAEAGARLFYIYDTDGNEVIDNIEYEKRSILSLMPVKTETTIRYDLDGDGLADKAETSSTLYFERTMLSRFDKNNDGISPHEFTGMAFNITDINNDHFVDLKEWEASYNTTLSERLKRQAETND